MSKKLNLGVVDVPYRYEQEVLSKKGKPLKKRRTVTKSMTTGQVADILEAKYNVFEIIYGLHEDEIAEVVTQSIERGLNAIENGAPADFDIFGSATSKIETIFKEAIANRELDGSIDSWRALSIPTQASLDGVSHRFAHPYAKRPSRPSFIDTGLYQSSIKSWVEE